MDFDSNFSIIYDNLSEYLDDHDISSLKEDMLQLQHGRLLIDAGYYESKFVIYLIEDHNWEKPLVCKESSSESLREDLSEICGLALDYELQLAGICGIDDMHSEFFRTIRDNKLRLRFVDGIEKLEILDKVNGNFVDGNPRALWMGLKHKPIRLGDASRDPYWRMLDYIGNDRVLYFIIDIDNDNHAVYQGGVKDIHTFIGDCECLDEYYLMSEDGKELWCATDHDELLYCHAV